ncbi:MAG: DUF3618 domain-containing protein [Nocardioides alkalitolerans]
MATPEGSSDEQQQPSVAELEEQVAQTRADLADTVEALAAKADVTGRAKHKAEEVVQHARASAEVTAGQAAQAAAHAREQLTDDRGRPTPVALGVAGGLLVLGLVVGVVVRRRRG